MPPWHTHTHWPPDTHVCTETTHGCACVCVRAPLHRYTHPHFYHTLRTQTAYDAHAFRLGCVCFAVSQTSISCFISLLSDVTFLPPAEKRAENILGPSPVQEEMDLCGFLSVGWDVGSLRWGTAWTIFLSNWPFFKSRLSSNSLVTVTKSNKQQPLSIENTCWFHCLVFLPVLIQTTLCGLVKIWF